MTREVRAVCPCANHDVVLSPAADRYSLTGKTTDHATKLKVPPRTTVPGPKPRPYHDRAETGLVLRHGYGSRVPRRGG